MVAGILDFGDFFIVLQLIRTTMTIEQHNKQFVNQGFLLAHVLKQRWLKRLCDTASWLPLAAGASSCNLGPIFLTISVYPITTLLFEPPHVIQDEERRPEGQVPGLRHEGEPPRRRHCGHRLQEGTHPRLQLVR